MPWRRIGEWRYNSTHSLTTALVGGEWSASRPGRFTPRERTPGNHWIGGWVGPRAGLDAVVNRIPSPRRQSNPRIPIVQPVAQRYTDWAITALSFFHYPNDITWTVEITEINVKLHPVLSAYFMFMCIPSPNEFVLKICNLYSSVQVGDYVSKPYG
jgi:hypothetical protein